jgi:hypothetical protein
LKKEYQQQSQLDQLHAAAQLQRWGPPAHAAAAAAAAARAALWPAVLHLQLLEALLLVLPPALLLPLLHHLVQVKQHLVCWPADLLLRVMPGGVHHLLQVVLPCQCQHLRCQRPHCWVLQLSLLRWTPLQQWLQQLHCLAQPAQLSLLVLQQCYWQDQQQVQQAVEARVQKQVQPALLSPEPQHLSLHW